MKFLARKGAVGGTARTIAKHYKYYRGIHPDKEEIKDSEIYRLIIIDRFKLSKIKQQRLLSEIGLMSGLKDLVVGILTIEADFLDNTMDIQIMFEEVIEEELLKKGIQEYEI